MSERTLQGEPADSRIIGAITALQNQFAVCGLAAPVAIVVAPGERARIERAVRRSPHLLIEDSSCTKTTIWGVEIREEEPAAAGLPYRVLP